MQNHPPLPTHTPRANLRVTPPPQAGAEAGEGEGGGRRETARADATRFEAPREGLTTPPVVGVLPAREPTVMTGEALHKAFPPHHTMAQGVPRPLDTERGRRRIHTANVSPPPLTMSSAPMSLPSGPVKANLLIQEAADKGGKTGHRASTPHRNQDVLLTPNHIGTEEGRTLKTDNRRVKKQILSFVAQCFEWRQWSR